MPAFAQTFCLWCVLGTQVFVWALFRKQGRSVEAGTTLDRLRFSYKEQEDNWAEQGETWTYSSRFAEHSFFSWGLGDPGCIPASRRQGVLESTSASKVVSVFPEQCGSDFWTWDHWLIWSNVLSPALPSSWHLSGRWTKKIFSSCSPLSLCWATNLDKGVCK